MISENLVCLCVFIGRRWQPARDGQFATIGGRATRKVIDCPLVVGLVAISSPLYRSEFGCAKLLFICVLCDFFAREFLKKTGGNPKGFRREGDPRGPSSKAI